MKEGIIRCGNGPAEASLGRMRLVSVNQFPGLSQEIIVVSHRRLGPFPIGALFRVAAEAEVWDQSPVFIWPNLIKERGHYLASDIGESLLVHRPVGQYDAKEDCRIAAGIGSDGVL